MYTDVNMERGLQALYEGLGDVRDAYCRGLAGEDMELDYMLGRIHGLLDMMGVLIVDRSIVVPMGNKSPAAASQERQLGLDKDYYIS